MELDNVSFVISIGTMLFILNLVKFDNWVIRKVMLL